MVKSGCVSLGTSVLPYLRDITDVLNTSKLIKNERNNKTFLYII